SWVAPDAVVQRAMRHSSPETKRWYQLGLVDQIREHLERVNEKTYEGRESLHNRDSNNREESTQAGRARREKSQPLHFRDTRRPAEETTAAQACN
ncbi:MAG: hypothetical protein ACREDR_47925, partial [Blastocatellia bacterium]